MYLSNAIGDAVDYWSYWSCYEDGLDGGNSEDESDWNGRLTGCWVCYCIILLYDD